MEYEFKRKEIEIEVPEGYEIDKENSTFEYIKFKPIKNKLPKTWEEFCDTHLKIEEAYQIAFDSTITSYSTNKRDKKCDRNLLPSKELAEAMLALCQLIQLRDCYNDGWTPDWTDVIQGKFCISTVGGKVRTSTCTYSDCILAFRSEELRDQFFENFKDLIEIAKPLL